MSALGVYYFFSYVFVLNYMLMDKKEEGFFKSVFMTILLSALTCFIACPIILSFLVYKIMDKLNKTEIEDDIKKIIKDNL